ncbi:MAG: Oligosaccharide flippase family protein, partial [Bacteroidota bacterium]|nr:Oligosaccharide flippase family protein [Bacteroidota bacterium]
ILLLMIVPVCTASTYKAILRGLKLMNPIAIIESITNILMFAAGALVVFTYPSIALIFGIYFIFELFRSAFYYYYLKSGYEMIVPSFLKIMPISILMNLKKNISSYIDSNTKTIKILFIEHFNLLAVNFLSVFQFRTPAFILGWIAANGEVGIFSAGQRFLTLLRVIPGAVLNAMLPEFASRKRSPGNALKAFAISFLTGAAIALPLYFLSDILIRFTFDFKEAIPILQILSLTFPFVMSNHTLEAYLLACKRERFGNYGLLVSITVIAAAILLSSVFDAKTAAYSALAGEASLTVLYLIFSLKR